MHISHPNNAFFGRNPGDFPVDFEGSVLFALCAAGSIREGLMEAANLKLSEFRAAHNGDVNTKRFGHPLSKKKATTKSRKPATPRSLASSSSSNSNISSSTSSSSTISSSSNHATTTSTTAINPMDERDGEVEVEKLDMDSDTVSDSSDTSEEEQGEENENKRITPVDFEDFADTMARCVFHVTPEKASDPEAFQPVLVDYKMNPPTPPSAQCLETPMTPLGIEEGGGGGEEEGIEEEGDESGAFKDANNGVTAGGAEGSSPLVFINVMSGNDQDSPEI